MIYKPLFLAVIATAKLARAYEEAISDPTLEASYGAQVQEQFDKMEDQTLDNSLHVLNKRDMFTDNLIATANAIAGPLGTLTCTNDARVVSFSFPRLQPPTSFSYTAIVLILYVGSSTTSDVNPNPLQFSTTDSSFLASFTGRFSVVGLSPKENMLVGIITTIPTSIYGKFVLKSAPFSCGANFATPTNYRSRIYYIKSGESTADLVGTLSTTLPNNICNPYYDTSCVSNLLRPYLPDPKWFTSSFQNEVVSVQSPFMIGLQARTGSAQDVYQLTKHYNYVMKNPSTYLAVSDYSLHYKGSKFVDLDDSATPVRGYYLPFNFSFSPYSETVPNTIRNSELKNFIKDRIAAKASPFSERLRYVNENTKSVMFIHLPKGLRVSYQNQVVCEELCGYHDVIDLRDTPNNNGVSTLYYTVIPFPDNTTCPGCVGLTKTMNAMAAVPIIASHEMMEVFTRVALQDNYLPGFAESSDVCNWMKLYQRDPAFGNPYYIHLVWNPVKNVCSYGTQFRRGSAADLYPGVYLSCPEGQRIKTIDFASYGTPTGDGPFQETCSKPGVKDIVVSRCLGQSNCSLQNFDTLFGSFCCKPCNSCMCEQNDLAVQYTCDD